MRATDPIRDEQQEAASDPVTAAGADRLRLKKRDLLLPFYALATVAAAFGLEALITGSIAFFAHTLGIAKGLLAFTGTWLLAGLLVLALTELVWPERARTASREEMGSSAVHRGISRLSARSRFVAALAVAWFFGPMVGPPLFRALGYHGRSLVAWVVVSAPIFCVFWFFWTVGGYRLLTHLMRHWGWLSRETHKVKSVG